MFLKRFASDETGATAVEYGLIGVLIAMIAISFMKDLSSEKEGASAFAATQEQMSERQGRTDD